MQHNEASPPAAGTLAAPGTGSRGGHLLAWSVLSVTGAVLLLSSFEGWGDAIVDLGRDLYLPSQILEGRVLYRDLLYNYGPAAPYLLAAVTAVLGDSLVVFAGVGGLIGLAVVAALYAIGHRLGGAALGFAAAFLFLLLNFFAASTWGCNFVLPYAFAATLGTAFSLGSFYLLLRYLYDGRRLAVLGGSVVLLFAALLSKQEVGLGIAAVHALAWWAHKVPRRAILLTLGSGVLVGVLFVGAFAARDAAEHALFAENLTKFARDAETGRFFQVVAGLDQPGPHLLRAAESAARLAAIVLLAAFGGLAPALWRDGRRIRAGLAVLSLAVCAGLVWQWAEVRMFQATPLLAVGAALVCLARDRRDPLLLLAVFALASGLRVLLQFHPMWYGFYLVVPAYPFVVYALGVRAAGLLPARRTVAVTLAALGLLIAVRFETAMWQAWRAKTSVLATAKGSLRDVPDGRAEAIAEFLRYAETHLAAAEPRMVVLPEGVSLNYFTGFPNPTAYYLFIPPEIGSAEVEQRMIRELEATRPELLLLTSRDVSEFGRRGIGVDYALALGDWIRGSYDLERVFEAGETPWRLILLRRREVG